MWQYNSTQFLSNLSSWLCHDMLLANSNSACKELLDTSSAGWKGKVSQILSEFTPATDSPHCTNNMANLGGKSEASSITGSDLQAFRAIFSILISALRQGLLSHPRKETPQKKSLRFWWILDLFIPVRIAWRQQKSSTYWTSGFKPFPFDELSKSHLKSHAAGLRTQRVDPFGSDCCRSLAQKHALPWRSFLTKRSLAKSATARDSWILGY